MMSLLPAPLVASACDARSSAREFAVVERGGDECPKEPFVVR